MEAYSEHTDAELMDLVKNDDHAAFTMLYKRHWRKLFVIASHKIKNHAVAEEIAQDIFADLWLRRYTIIIQTNFTAYLSVALKYKVIDTMAKASHRHKYEVHLSDTNSIADDSTREWLNFEDLRDKLARLVNELPEKCRIVYQLKDAGHSYKEIANELGIAEKTVESHLGKAMKTIRTKLSLFFFSLLL